MRLLTFIRITIPIFLLCSTYSSNAATGNTWSDAEDGTVIDISTGLIWQKESDFIQRNYDQAVEYCEDLTLAGSSNWRLPNIKELHSIIDFRRRDLAIEPNVFTDSAAGFYWSITILPVSPAGEPGSARVVDVRSGAIGFLVMTTNLFTRCVQ